MTGIHNVHNGPGTQNNYHGLGQNINYGGDQNILSGAGNIITGQLNIGGNFVQSLGTGVAPDGYKILSDKIAGVGGSHKAEHQFSRGACLKGTRTRVLGEIDEWVKGKFSPICWVSGAAGVGKSAIALSAAQDCEKSGRLVSSFFFFRSDPRRNNSSALALSIAYGLGAVAPTSRTLIHERVVKDPIILDGTLEDQFRELVFEPSSIGLQGHSPDIIIIDGLDECGDEKAQLRILHIIASYIRTTQPILRFLILSRPESWIRAEFGDDPLCQSANFITLDTELYTPMNDVELYLRHEFKRIASSRRYSALRFPCPWPSDEDLQWLVSKSSGQFIYATTIVIFVDVGYRHPVEQLGTVLSYTADFQPSRATTSPYGALDNLYSTILAVAHHDFDEIRPILAALLIIPDHSRAALSLRSLDILFGLQQGEMTLKLRGMHAVLNITEPDANIRPYHTSFIEYLVDKARAGKFHIDRYEQHGVLVRAWLQVLSVKKAPRV
ncbi:hypothetical protein AAF712_016543 [Marasmius tenuissimus]|uniref:Nephrocystin 3-like N-terminal domain-containing protein n=1 Tax=Marasmius tenuissimus TaxID=585030 RepID=A0ABR2Z780_9AGAR